MEQVQGKERKYLSVYHNIIIILIISKTNYCLPLHRDVFSGV